MIWRLFIAGVYGILYENLFMRKIGRANVSAFFLFLLSFCLDGSLYMVGGCRVMKGKGGTLWMQIFF